MYHQTVKSIVIEDSVVDPFSGGMLVIDLLISFCAARAGMGIGGRVRRMLHVKCGCNGENCKINIARAIFSFVHEVNPMLVRGAKGFV